jgi:hypothetical protein
MRIPSLLLLVTLTACTQADPSIVGAWTIVRSSGVPSQTFVPGRTLQLFGDGRAVVSGTDVETRAFGYEVIRTFDMAGDLRPMVAFEGDDSPFVIVMPTRTELILEENEGEAVLLTLRRAH